ncbi:sialic acid TRAP transporter substrate-binding protein SiaP [Stappia taiwanensis]|uniref:Sialic acid TRAP transporter substrate-binding protein SiaP n=1 Tax=Stappia taiwanensis TaxID=992267 RepID=A0A838XRG5_9HYPH|nr:sialic acid TRAP transporter substrate-binding protein SiaP [Stappia taiwanensis]MBA4612902.1 sialic acid TRAP transporter substrate-binding protein SiaP [Stappia taiwanensis]GGF06934.1 ABC transporter substrate-binding protein [Stappia taiwanensis]
MSIKTSCKSLLLAGAALALMATGASAVEWRLGHILPPDHPGNRALERAAEEIAERTDNRIEIKVFPAGQIGGAKEILTGMTIGTHQMAFDGAGILSQWSSQLGVLEAPYLAKDFRHLERLIDSKKGHELVEALRTEHGLRLLDVWYYGTRHMTNNARPIETPADVEGLKLRVPEVALSLEFVKALGGRPTPMAFPELYLGLQTGVVDGQENPLPTINAAKFYEVQTHLALTGHLVQFVAPLVAEDAWNAASEGDRAVVMEVLQTVGDDYNASVIALEKELVAALEEKGMAVTRPDREAFATAVQPIFGQFAEVWGPDTYGALAEID